MSFCAKNARTTTMRMGKAALLKNLLMASKTGPRGPWSAIQRSTVPARLRRGLTRLQGGHVGQIAVLLGVVEAVSDGEAVGDLEPHVADRQVHLAPLGLDQQGAHLQRRGLPRAQAAQQVVEG